MMPKPVMAIMIFACLAASCLVPASSLEASTSTFVGRAGATYPVAEKDALSELMHKVRQVDWKKQLAGLKQSALSYEPPDLARLPRAKHDRMFTVDPTYTLTFEIPDGKGGILYPKGYTFNPLDYVGLPDVFVFIDGGDKKQMEWFMRSPYAKESNVMIFLTGGSYLQLSKKLKRPVFYATDQITRRFRLKAVPAALFQQGRFLEVKEFEIKNSK
ncbi:MAG: hypothetical protein M0Z75_08545 [Nitrospiraceae bacterium]|nr:hypothetical protein [Nitrospiraceae bacterium]